MEKFSITNEGYNVDEVNSFLDKLIRKFESMVNEIAIKNDTISNLKKENNELANNPDIAILKRENNDLKEKLSHYTKMEESLNKALLMAQKTSDQMRVSANEQAEIIVSEAKNNANRIINEALLKSEKIQYETDIMRRNLVVFKKRLRGVIETQLDLVDDIEKIDI